MSLVTFECLQCFNELVLQGEVDNWATKVKNRMFVHVGHCEGLMSRSQVHQVIAKGSIFYIRRYYAGQWKNCIYNLFNNLTWVLPISSEKIFRKLHLEPMMRGKGGGRLTYREQFEGLIEHLSRIFVDSEDRWSNFQLINIRVLTCWNPSILKSLYLSIGISFIKTLESPIGVPYGGPSRGSNWGYLRVRSWGQGLFSGRDDSRINISHN